MHTVIHSETQRERGRHAHRHTVRQIENRDMHRIGRRHTERAGHAHRDTVRIERVGHGHRDMHTHRETHTEQDI